MKPMTKAILKTSAAVVGDVAANYLLGRGIVCAVCEAKTLPGKIAMGVIGAAAACANVYAWSVLGGKLGLTVAHVVEEQEMSNDMDSYEFNYDLTEEI